MFKYFKPMRLNLQLFADGAADGGNGAQETGATEAVAAPHTRAKANPLEDVIYGKQAEQPVQPTSQAEETTVTPEQLKAEFKGLITGDGKFKDLYNEGVEKIVKNRLKGIKPKAERMDALAPTIELLAQRYGIEADDENFISALNKAIEDDDKFLADEAMERGISVDELKNIRKLERENAVLRRSQQEAEDRRRADEIYTKWLSEAEQMKGIYPEFDLQTELQNNPQFVDLIQLPTVDVRTAYEITHKDEIVAAHMQVAAKTVEKKLANSVAANAKRPTENGVAAANAQKVKKDVASFTRADRDEIRRRVARGEEIIL